MTFAPEALEELDERVARRPSPRPETEIVLCAAEPCATEMSVRVGETAFEEVLIDVHTGAFRFRYLSRLLKREAAGRRGGLKAIDLFDDHG